MAMNADFRIGLTGTPIENAAIDLWTIMDILAPGSLGSAADFRGRYSDPGEDNMVELHERVFLAQGGAPPLALRRMKDDVARDLPSKTRRLHPRLMPAGQAEEYDNARRKLAEGGAGAALKMLHHIRSVSVHPGGEERRDDTDFIHASGRMAATFDILDRLHANGERALIFIEHRALQYRVAEILRQRYRLPRVEIINGDTPIQRRQRIVNAFQENLGAGARFDVLVLGPKAAGTGLTLTAATHVIHLSRWWNPAVEEQCNDRVHRIGQTRPVTIHLPLAIHPAYAEGSFDCLLQNLMQRKRRLAKKALWPMGDTSQDAEEIQSKLRGESSSVTANPLERALKDMFSRENQPVPPVEPDGSRIVS
jgi:SNF2 family DNA or RNA helicase